MPTFTLSNFQGFCQAETTPKGMRAADKRPRRGHRLSVIRAGCQGAMVYLWLLTLQRNISSPNFKSRMSSVLIGCTSSTQQAHKAQNKAVLIKYESIAKLPEISKGTHFTGL